MAIPIVLYSATSWLAYTVAERYYGAKHFVWCAPVFDASSLYAREWHVPPTSSPSEIYKGLMEEVKRRDRHSAKIAQNKIGIIRGASVKRSAGVITKAQEKEIVAVVKAAETADFAPLLYVIPYQLVSKKLKMVPVAERAHPLSTEFIIPRLPRRCFDVIEIL
jgi:hypothetical protein